MDGIHDLGGMDGFGSLPPDEPDDASPFHEDWEGLVYAAYVAGVGNDAFDIDEFRYRLERLDPGFYLHSSYYERWVTGIADLFVEAGTIDREELEARTAAFERGEAELPAPGTVDGKGVEDLLGGVTDAYQSGRDPVDPAFAVGDRVRVEKRHPKGHTRCPRYIRGAEGEVAAHRGTHVLPDANAHGDPVAEPLYNVRFDATDLWGEGNTDADAVRIECWESYLAPAAGHGDSPDSREVSDE